MDGRVKGDPVRKEHDRLTSGLDIVTDSYSMPALQEVYAV